MSNIFSSLQNMCSLDDGSCPRSANMSKGCPIPVGNSICGETNSLEIMKEFTRLYEERIAQMDSEAGGDCLQEKIKLQQEWIRNLTQQNEMLVTAVQELEYEATERVQQLEDKLHKSAQCLCEVMKRYREHDFAADLLDEPLQKIRRLEDDIKNVLEFIRRIRETDNWNLDGLFFYSISEQELMGTKFKYAKKSAVGDNSEGEKIINDKERTVQELTQKLNYYNSFGDVEAMARELQSRRKECESLQQEMTDMRQALTEEVAEKHDQIVLLKKDIQVFEERCRQADKQTAFKEDIIRELRKEIKQLKQQVTEKYLNLVADQLEIYFKNYKSEQATVTERGDEPSKFSEILELKRCIQIKDNLLTEQLHLIKLLVTKLFNLDRGLKFLEERTSSVANIKLGTYNKEFRQFQESLNQTTSVAESELESLQSKIRKLETENDSLRETLTQDKTHIEQLDEQFKSFLQERDELKRKNKALEKKSKTVYKENDTLRCKCEVLKTEIQQLKETNEKLHDQVEVAQKHMENFKAESVACQEKMQQILEENRKTIEQVISLNEENRNLSQSIDVLRQRSEFTNSFTQEEVSKLNATIGELRDNLERTRVAQEEEEKNHHKEITLLNETITKLEQELQNVEGKYGTEAKNHQKEITLLNETINKLEQEQRSVEGKYGKATRNHQKEITLLNETVSKLEQELQSVEGKYGKEAKNHQKEITLLNETINKLEQELQSVEGKYGKEAKSYQEERVLLNETINNLERKLQSVEGKYGKDAKSHQKEITFLNETISNLEQELQGVERQYGKEAKNHEKEIISLNETISNLEQELQNVEGKYEKEAKTCKICKGRSKVGFLEHSEVQADLESNESELIKMLNDVESKMAAEIDRRDNEIQLLKNKVNELELSLKICEERAANLQDAVKLYSNSVNVLESSGEEAKFQINQQKITIANLQQALVEAKQEIDEMRKKNQDNDVKNQKIVVLLEDVLQDTKEENDFIIKQVELVNREYDLLQDLNFSLEVEHCDSLQDINMLESHLNKYKYSLKINEEHLKKLSKQKRCYEEIITYFKQEMSLMADQLNNLQELLTLSNEAAHQESSKIMQAFVEVQSINEKLSNQLCACEQKVQLENQMNQLHEAKICELQQLISEKELDLSKHDQAVLNIRKTLNDSLKQNEALQETIVQLNDTISSLQEAIKQYEYENCASKKSCQEFQEQIGGYCAKLDELKKHLDDKTAECLKLEMAYNNEKRALKAAQKQLQETENLQHQHQQELVKCLEELKQKLALCDENNSRLCKECESLQAQLSNLSRRDAVKDLEIKRYRKIVGDLKSTMMELNTELNKNLAQKDLKTCCKNVNCPKNIDKDDPKLQDICLGCPCEVEFYQKMVDILKKSVSELKRKLSDTQQRNKALEEQLKQKDQQLSEVEGAKEKLNQKMLESLANDQKISELEREIDRLTQELQVKSLQLNDVKKSANEINGSKCVQLACAQEEISSLKNEMTNILNRQYVLKRENEELQSQTAQLHCTINCLNEKNQLFKDQIDQYAIKVKNLTTEKETLLRKNKELLGELRSLQSMTYTTDKQQRLTSESLKQLEADIEDLKHNKEEICLESKNVIKNVRAWVNEQKRINSFVAKREREFINTIKQLNSAKRECAAISSLNRGPTPNKRSAMYSNLCTSPCSLGSQGTASFYDGGSPPPSPDFGPNNEWYSTNFRTESDNSEEEYCVNTLENLTQQMRMSNKIWMDEKRSRRDCRVTKDVKDKN